MRLSYWIFLIIGIACLGAYYYSADLQQFIAPGANPDIKTLGNEELLAPGTRMRSVQPDQGASLIQSISAVCGIASFAIQIGIWSWKGIMSVRRGS